MEDYLKDTIETYNRIAQDYVQTTQNRRPQIEFDAFCQSVISGGQVLDVGCGWGRDCRALVERGFSVTGIDLSAEMLKLAQAFVPNCSFLQALQTLTEFKRLLKTGASCCILVKKGSGEGVVEHSPGNPRFFTYFHEDEIRKACLSLGFNILDERVANEKESRSSEGRDQDWIYFLVRAYT